MLAAWYEKNGAARDVLELGEMTTPEPGAGEVRVRLATSGVNPSDVKGRMGRPLQFRRVVPHSDGAGIVEAVGADVPESRVGQRVWIWNGQWKRPFGTAATHIVVPQAQAVPLADGIDFDVASCLGIPGLTAWHAVELCGGIEGRSVLVTGAASAVGHYAVQMARLKGARVIGTVSSQRRDHAAQAGADVLVDYRSDDLAMRLRDANGGEGVDFIIDMDFASTAPLLGQGVLKPHGTHVAYGSNRQQVTLTWLDLLWNSLTLKFFVVYDLTQEERIAAIEGLTRLLDEGKLMHTIGERFPLAEIAAAHEAVEGGRVVGNVVLDCS
jgi:NADPH:quinone reductase